MRMLAVLLLCGLWLGCRSKPDENQNPGTGNPPPAETACAPSEKPTCCEDCGDVLWDPVCANGSWSCPKGTTDSRQCQGVCGQPVPPHPQTTYTYPGCANEDYGCPRYKTITCALELIRTEHASCAQDSDCVAAEVDDRCAGYGQCPPAMVSVAGRADFEAKANAELLRYCTEFPLCAVSGSCSISSFEPRCRQGVCMADWPDAGP
ncbi:hypothetical protein F0U61_29905 [Archangium violaceum]|uniref:hypothetical protein n=1 Tax=Archangium violaceum TaxID=83451 RepID=UPI002B28E937|nr:hypothetical protein F0U61_29905 [Archangium violaceum]